MTTETSLAVEATNRTTVDSGALTMALNVLHRAGKTEVADALEATALRAALASPLEVAAPVTDEEVEVACKTMHHITYSGNVFLMRRVLEQFAASRVPVASPAVPADVLKAAISFQKDGYRGPLMWARKVFDWVVETGATPPGGAGGAGVMDARPDSFHSDSGECDRVQGPGPTDAERYQYMIDCDFQAGRKYVPTLDEADYKARLRAKHDAAILAKGGDQGEGK